MSKVTGKRAAGGGKHTEDRTQTAEESRHLAETVRVKSEATKRNLLSSTKPLVQRQPPSKSLRKFDGADIIKKGARHKMRYLFSLPGRFISSQGGTLGELTQLNTPNPILYINFPQGRLRLRGTLVYPKAKYLALKPQKTKGRQSLVITDSFDVMVVFVGAEWVGMKESNPSEEALPWPSDLPKLDLKIKSLRTSLPANGEPLTGRKRNRVPDTAEDDISPYSSNTEGESSVESQHESPPLRNVRKPPPTAAKAFAVAAAAGGTLKQRTLKDLLGPQPPAKQQKTSVVVVSSSEEESTAENGSDAESEVEYVPRPTSRGRLQPRTSTPTKATGVDVASL